MSLVESAGVPILSVSGLTVTFGKKPRWWSRRNSAMTAVDHISFEIQRGKVLGIAGESGSGKSTTAKAVGRLLTPDSGSIFLEGADLGDMRGEALRRLRKDFQFVFQDPYASLNRRMNLENLIAEPLKAHGIGTRESRHERVLQLMASVGLPADWAGRFPRSLSGGQRQRVAIARALALDPKLLICDEPISALDVSIQAQIVNLLRDLQTELGLTMIFISHDLSMMRYLADEIIVMRRGVIVEQAETLELFANAVHPYTRKLLASIPAGGPHAAARAPATHEPGPVLAALEGLPDSDSGMAIVKPGHLVSRSLWEAGR